MHKDKPAGQPRSDSNKGPETKKAEHIFFPENACSTKEPGWILARRIKCLKCPAGLIKTLISLAGSVQTWIGLSGWLSRLFKRENANLAGILK